METVNLKDYYDAPISRSQAKRLKKEYYYTDELIIDLKDIGFLSRSFIDEMFRVVASNKLKVNYINASEEVNNRIGSIINNI